MRAEQHRLRSVVFVGEQDGEVERDLKDRLTERFRSNSQLTEAYLVSVRYDDPKDVHVALCLRTALGINDPSLVKAANAEFVEMFANTQSLDIFFLTPAQAEQVSSVARPFYSRPASRG